MVQPLAVDDAKEILRIATSWESGEVILSSGAHGAVVKEGDKVLAYAFLRETGYGFVVDDLWQDKSRGGLEALAELSHWLEGTVARIAAERNVESIPLGGIAKLDNPRHRAALEHRGYEHVANVYAKDIPANVSQGTVA